MRFGISNLGLRISFCVSLLITLGFSAVAQIPQPGPPKSVSIPAVKESKLKNGLRVAVVEKHSSPLVTVQLLIQAGAGIEDEAARKAASEHHYAAPHRRR